MKTIELKENELFEVVIKHKEFCVSQKLQVVITGMKIPKSRNELSTFETEIYKMSDAIPIRARAKK